MQITFVCKFKLEGFGLMEHQLCSPRKENKFMTNNIVSEFNNVLFTCIMVFYTMRIYFDECLAFQ